jgi:hypothetical protein
MLPRRQDAAITTVGSGIGAAWLTTAGSAAAAVVAAAAAVCRQGVSPTASLPYVVCVEQLHLSVCRHQDKCKLLQCCNMRIRGSLAFTAAVRPCV